MSIIKVLLGIVGIEYVSVEDRLEALEQFIAEREGEL